jgi:hypothetical protein
MASTITISGSRNPLDGVHAQVDVAGTPSGMLTFYISRTPQFSAAVESTSWTEVTAVDPPAVTYNVVTPGAELYYIWAVDGNGQGYGNPGVVFVGTSNIMDFNLVGILIRTILQENIAALQVALQQNLPGVTIKSVVFGAPSQVEDWPAIYITEPTKNTSYVSFPWGKLHEFRTSISCVIMHQDRVTALQAALQLGMAVEYILNTPPYEENALASGTVLYRCMCAQSATSDVQVDTNKWAGGCDLSWTGNAYIIDTLQGNP